MMNWKQLLAMASAITMLQGAGAIPVQAITTQAVLTEQISEPAPALETCEKTEGIFTFTITKDISTNYIFATISSCSTEDTSVEIPAEIDTIPITQISNTAFDSCVNLEKITLAENQENFLIIDDALFNRAGTNLICCPPAKTSLLLPDTLKSIAVANLSRYENLQAVSVSENHETYSSIDGVLYSKDGTELLYYPCGKQDESFTLPESVVKAGRFSMQDNAFLKTLTVSYGVKEFEWVCQNMANLETVYLPDSITALWYTFEECPNLKDIYYHGTLEQWQKLSMSYQANMHYEWAEDALHGEQDGIFWQVKDNAVSIYDYTGNAENLTIPESIQDLPVTEIDDNTFDNCETLKEITLPDSITRIGREAFENCTNLTAIKLPEQMTAIEEKTFQSCKSLTSVTIPEGVTSIGKDAFRKCSALASVSLPEGLTELKGYAFADTALESVTLPDSVTKLEAGIFMDCHNLKSAELSPRMASITNDMFRNTQISALPIPLSVKSIGYNAFEGSAIETITLPESVTEISEEAFFFCHELESITILNPDCEIYNDVKTICNLYLEPVPQPDNMYDPSIDKFNKEEAGAKFTGTIYGYENSTAQAYAEKYGYTFVVINDQQDPTETTAPTEPPIYDADFKLKLEIKTEPEKLIYKTGEEFDATGLTVQSWRLTEHGYTIPDHQEQAVSPSDYPDMYQISGFDSSKAGDCEVTITYSQYNDILKKEVMTSASFTVKIQDNSGTELPIGDLDNSQQIDIMDVILLNKAVLGKEIFSDAQAKASDLNRNGTLDAGDSLILMKYIVGLITEL